MIAAREIARALERALQGHGGIDAVQTDTIGDRIVFVEVYYSASNEPFARLNISKLADIMESELS